MAETHMNLSELLNFSNGKARPSGTNPGEFPVYGANGIIGLSNATNSENGVSIIGRVGSYCGTVHYSPSKCWVTDNAIIATPKEGVNPRFCYFLLKFSELNRHRIGSGQPLLTQEILKNLRISRHSAQDQDNIAAILGALDDKIAANERTAATIETLLRSKYESLNTGDRSICIGQIGSLVRDPVKANSLSADALYIGLEHMPRKSIWLNSWGVASEVSSTKNLFRSGDLLFGRLRPYFHKVGLAQISGVCSTDIIVLRALKPEYRPWLLMALSSDEVIAHATARSDGTRMPRVKWADLAEFQIPWAGSVKVARFEEIAAPLIKRAECGAAESRTLAALRDTLLPQLMSGKLRVRDAERIVEDAV
ncbi:restriction endonuclease subunit S [Thermobifida halotolerans]|uniref:Restriction endonuclease subunit S n=1 Tax=Thermobifida halotolerans TaxID=483545 RepID=A0AA97M5X6_9ACTN|nr:restriction endonuclease subunit S [Thermobifida halotolerans]UOE21452.1 restriction endonuclease subunit S [Thermobifida halotolerans]